MTTLKKNILTSNSASHFCKHMARFLLLYNKPNYSFPPFLFLFLFLILIFSHSHALITILINHHLKHITFGIQLEKWRKPID